MALGNAGIGNAQDHNHNEVRVVRSSDGSRSTNEGDYLRSAFLNELQSGSFSFSDKHCRWRLDAMLKIEVSWLLNKRHYFHIAVQNSARSGTMSSVKIEFGAG